MKKIISLFLTLCMLVTCCALFASCSSGVSEKDVEKDAQAVISEAVSKTGDAFFSEGLEMDAVLEEALKGGSIAITFKSDMILGEGGEVNETVYFNGNENKLVSDTVVKLDGAELAARLFVDKDGVLISSESLLGSTTAYAIKPATLASGFTTSPLKTFLEGMMGELNAETAAQINEALAEVKTQYESLFDQNYDEKMNDNINALYATLKQSVATEKVDGEKSVVITYTINNETLDAFVDKMIEIAGLDSEMAAEAKQQLEGAIATINENATVSLSAKMVINKKEATVSSITLNGTVTPKAEGENAVTVDAKVTFGASEIALNLSMTDGEENYGVNAKIAKTTADKKSVYTATLNVVEGETSEEFAKIVYTYAKDTGAFTLDVDAAEGEIDATVAGTIQVAGGNATISVTSIGMGEMTINLELTIKINKQATMPTAPTNVKDIVTMTEEDINALLEGVMSGPIGALIGSSSPDVMP